MKSNLHIICWMGGSRPRKSSQIDLIESATRKFLFREQVQTWRNYWGDSPDWDTLRLFFGRARHDAHATLRN